MSDGNRQEEAIDQNEFEEFTRAAGLSSEQGRAIRAKLTETLAYHPRIGVLGKTGAGKSSLCNAVFGSAESKVSHVGGGTREQTVLEIKDEQGRKLSLIDMPGLSESGEFDREYLPRYKELLPKLDAVLWVVKGDERTFAVDEDVYTNMILPALRKRSAPVIFVVTQLRKVDPIDDWDVKTKQPGPAQKRTIDQQLALVAMTFDVKPSNVVGVSAAEGYGLVELVDRLVVSLPPGKRYSIVREAKSAAVSTKAVASAKDGVWETIKEAAKTVALTIAPIVLNKLGDYLKRKFPFF